MINYLKKMRAEKQEYRRYKRAIKQLPPRYQAAMTALDKYMWSFAGDDQFIHAMWDVLQIFQESSLEHVAVSDIVGADPVAFAQDIMDNYADHLWINKSQTKLRQNFKRIEDQNASN